MSDRSGGPGAGSDPCTYIVGTPEELAPHLTPLDYIPSAAEPAADGEVADAAPADPARSVLVYCPYRTGGPATQLVDVFPAGEPPSAAAATRVAQQAVTIPLPAPTFSPGAEHFQVVGIETWVWLDEAETATQTNTACLPPASYACVTVTASFVEISADMADGSPLLHCEGAGVAYDLEVEEVDQRDVEHCGHVYIETPDGDHSYPATVGATWSAAFSCTYDTDGDGVRESTCPGGFLGYISRVSDPVPLEVRDLQARATATS